MLTVVTAPKIERLTSSESYRQLARRTPLARLLAKLASEKGEGRSLSKGVC